MTSSSPVSSPLRYVGPWICIGGAAVYVVASPLFLRGPLWVLWWSLAGAAVIGTVVAGVVMLARSDRQRATELQRRGTDLQQCHAERRSLETRCEARRVALECLAEQQLPAVLAGTPTSPLPDVAADDVAAGLLGRAATVVAQIRDGQRTRQEAMQSAVVALARKVQASAHRIQEESSRMVDTHPRDQDVLDSGMRMDHAAAQQARHAQSLAALCGEWPGQQWHEPLLLAEVVRGAAGRITAYPRVAVSGDPAVAVKAHVLEPLIHVVAELLANATQSSPPATQVSVTFRQVQRGAVVEIEDGGVGLANNELQHAREIASGRRVVSLAELGAPPQTGLPVVGAYARRHGFRVDLKESVYGGLLAVVVVPVELTEPVTVGMVPAGQPTLIPPQTKQNSHTDPGLDRVEVSAASSRNQTLPPLPRRRSRRGEALPASTVDRPGGGTPQQTAEQAGDWMGAYLTAGSASQSGAHHTYPLADADDTAEER